MISLIFRIGIFVLLVSIIYFYLVKHKNKKPDEYIWVGNGDDPFKEK